MQRRFQPPNFTLGAFDHQSPRITQDLSQSHFSQQDSAPNYRKLSDSISSGSGISAVTYQEAGHVLIAKRGVNGLYDLEDFLAIIKAEIVPHDVNLAAMSLEAFRRYGKGIDPKARLNFCDCAAYALAKGMNAPLLFKGNDFTETDVQSAL
jgi:ribonuclease VapC